MIGHYAVWRLGLRRANQNWAQRRRGRHQQPCAIAADGPDRCFIVNTRNFGGAKAMGEAPNDISVPSIFDAASKIVGYVSNTILTT